jgi:uncharacterized protein YbjT (DUF2867 family)
MTAGQTKLVVTGATGNVGGELAKRCRSEA